MAEIIVSHGLCSAIRPKVMTALEPYGFRDLKVEAWGTGHYHLPVPPSQRMPDSDIWVRHHYARITVSDAAAAWAERLLWQAGTVWLETPPLNKGLKWEAPLDCKAGVHGWLGRGDMPTPWSASKGQSQPKKRAKRARVKQPKAGLLARVIDFLNRI